MQEVAAELRALYTVPINPSSDRSHNGKWHEIKIEVAQPELIVRTRPGYFFEVRQFRVSSSS